VFIFSLEKKRGDLRGRKREKRRHPHLKKKREMGGLSPRKKSTTGAGGKKGGVQTFYCSSRTLSQRKKGKEERGYTERG